MPISQEMLQTLVLMAGVGQLLLAAGSVVIPRVLRWKEKLAGLDPLLRRVFWVYAAYILMTNVALGLVSVLAAESLVEPAALAFAVALYAAVYWGARLAIQFAFFRGLKPPGAFFRIAEAGLVALFTFLTAVYIAAAIAAASGRWV